MADLVKIFRRKQIVVSEINDYNPLTMSDEHILEEIYSTHVHSDTVTKFDAESLFNIAAVILRRSTYVAENFVQVCHIICRYIFFFYLCIMIFVILPILI
jgi:hypothetical protein